MTSRRGFLGALAALASLKVPYVEDRVKRIGESISRAYAARKTEATVRAMTEKTVIGGYSDIAEVLKEAYPPQTFLLGPDGPEVFHGSFKIGERGASFAALSKDARARVKDCEKELEKWTSSS